MDYQTFATRQEAVNEIENTAGWEAKPVRMSLPSATDPQELTNVLVIEVRSDKRSTPLYLRSDGFCR